MKLPSLVTILFLLACCNAHEANSVNLAFDFKSRTSILDVQGQVINLGAVWGEVEVNSLDKQDKRPPYELLKVKIDRYRNDLNGDFFLYFYNKKLMSVRFYPNDWSAFKKHLENELNEKPINSEFEKKRDNLHIHVSKDAYNKIYIEWEDIGLKEDMSEWLAKYS